MSKINSSFHNPSMTIDFQVAGETALSKEVEAIEVAPERTQAQTSPAVTMDMGVVDSGAKDMGITMDVKPEENAKDEAGIFVEIINRVADQVFQGEMDAYEGYEEDVPSLNMLVKLLQHNVRMKEDMAVEDFVEHLPDITAKVLEYSLTSKDETRIKEFIGTLVNTESSLNLSIETPSEREREACENVL